MDPFNFTASSTQLESSIREARDKIICVSVLKHKTLQHLTLATSSLRKVQDTWKTCWSLDQWWRDLNVFPDWSWLRTSPFESVSFTLTLSSHELDSEMKFAILILATFNQVLLTVVRGIGLETPTTIALIIISCDLSIARFQHPLSWQIMFALFLDITRRQWARLEFERRIWLLAQFLSSGRPRELC